MTEPDYRDPGDDLTPCPVCGSFVGGTLALAAAPALLAVCDVLVVKALEKVGKMLARNGGNRNRVKVASSVPWYRMHTVIRPTAKDIDKGLHGAWDVIPAMLDTHGCCGVTSRQTEQMVDSYVRDLLVTGTAHSFSELQYRFERFLGIPLPLAEGYEPAEAHARGLTTPTPVDIPPVPVNGQESNTGRSL